MTIALVSVARHAQSERAALLDLGQRQSRVSQAFFILVLQY